MLNVTPFAVIPYTGGKISRPGIYSGVPIKIYHGQCCDGPSFSSGNFRKVESKNVEHAFKSWSGNPDYEPEPEKEAWIFGRAAHTLLLGESGFKETFLIRPETYPDDPGKAWHGASKSCKAWLGAAELAKKSVLKPDDVPNIRGMADRLGGHPLVQQGILNGLVEHSIFWRRRIKVSSGRVVTIWLKARPDAIPMSDNMLVDFKAVADAGARSVSKSITEFGYHQQLSLGVEGIFATTGRHITDNILLNQEKTKPWSINVKPIPAVDIEYGHRQNLRAMTKLAECLDTGEWGMGYDDDGAEGGLTQYARDRLAYEAEQGLLPPIDPHPDFADDDEEVV